MNIATLFDTLFFNTVADMGSNPIIFPNYLKSKFMKKLFFMYILFFSCIFISCRTQEQKADKLIEEQFFKTLLDFESYQKIETKIIDCAYRNGLNSEECIKDAEDIVFLMKEAFKNSSEAEESNIMSIQLYYLNLAEEQINKSLVLCENLKNKIKTYNHNEIIGYEVIHRFRCKNRGGQFRIVDYRFIVDSKMKKILFYNDLEEENYKEAIALIQGIEQEIKEEENTNS